MSFVGFQFITGSGKTTFGKIDSIEEIFALALNSPKPNLFIMISSNSLTLPHQIGLALQRI